MNAPRCTDGTPDHVWTINPEEAEGCTVLRSIERCPLCGVARVTYCRDGVTTVRYARKRGAA